MTDRSLDILIDEVVLGLADDADVARIEGMAARDPEIAARLDHARARFAPLDDTADEIALPEGFWSRVEGALDMNDAETAPTSADVVDLSAIRRAMTRWRNAAVGGIAAALLLAMTLGWTLMTPVEPSVIAVLLNDDGEAIALVEGRPDNTTLVTLLEMAQVPTERVMQVWTKPDDDGPPVSLGLLTSGRSETLVIEGLPAPHPQQLYEITVEPAGGSPTNLPTGPILGKGLAKEPVI
ncbi:anti-sigma factor [Tritonibacter mobilis]|uniref:anti-sigma factor n=1 Tax=Tritonibacter mobilis TaxID=379347 RepID=UPI000806A268|nr:anti-sigma factor [Tritonibacter mobilis]MBU3033768.1 anti-sigma factor [Tritonibacter mobilis]WHQ84821.1 anti-sigma factor [Tritonibacter mobilis]